MPFTLGNEAVFYMTVCMSDCELHFDISVSGILNAKTLYFSHRRIRLAIHWSWKYHFILFCLGNDHIKNCFGNAL